MLDSGSSPPREPMLARLGRFVIRRRWPVLAASLVIFAVALLSAAGALSALSLSRFEAPGSESLVAAEVLEREFGTGGPNMALLVTAKSGDVDDPAVVAAGLALTRELAARPEVAEAGSYWSRGASPALKSADGAQALVLARVPGDATQTRGILGELSPQFTKDDSHIAVGVGGREEVFRQVGAQAGQDFVRAEMLIFPMVFVLLVLVFRGFAAALLTLGTGVFAMVSTVAALRLTATVTEVSTFALNITLAMGLGLGVDYCLFIINRFREGLRAGVSPHQAIVVSMQTAGRTVLFSGLTVAISLLGLLLFPFPFLRSFAYAGFFVVLFSIVGVLFTLPAALAVVGGRIGAGVRGRSPRGGQGFWHRTAITVMRRPATFGGAVVAVLLLLGSPILGLRFGLPDDRVLPPEASSRQVSEEIRANFGIEESDAVHLIAADVGAPDALRGQVDSYATALSRVEGVAQVDTMLGRYADGEFRPADPVEHDRFTSDTGTWLSVVPETAVMEADPLGFVQDVRDVPPPFAVQVGGYPAELSDFRQAMLERLPLVLSVIFGITFVILFLMTGSLVLPLKATLLNLLSLTMMFGALVWIFQQGNLSGILGFTATGTLETSIPILMFCIAYGLSMDYEVFMMSRIKEEYDRTGDNETAVAVAIERSAPLITAAAAILAVSFATYASSGVIFLKMLGVGLALAVLVDATLIRAVLVPAFMRLAGAANWWAPAPLKRIHTRFGISESGPAPVG
ncbi:putative drug exporter of the RND superfamily [Saccharopolyspora kobensis]|uniref:Drug exporter of the RND superfamily n=1 Tax=Saccharopolyspora kobensis TaxID=146035 RepID=A0A1H6EJR7_9PSEU|nr:MMPL family transporter [Saccharopolyspora kobensis]SEG97105.1 putative drug exporter of the RND superfamily [Saccharopolyspora kobensis]SFE66516.1 putative drug exporter of the RND superfamily [Saccharopolyspora kobensis]